MASYIFLFAYLSIFKKFNKHSFSSFPAVWNGSGVFLKPLFRDQRDKLTIRQTYIKTYITTLDRFSQRIN